MFTQKEVVRFLKKNFRGLYLAPNAKLLLYKAANEQAGLLLLAAELMSSRKTIDRAAIEDAAYTVSGQ